MATYLVCGAHAVDGVAPGRHLDLDDDDRARQLLRAGHIRPAPARRATKRKASAR